MRRPAAHWRRWPAARRGAALLAAALLVAVGCERIAPVRTLPQWVRGIYIPMIQNDSYEPAVEELATILTQEAFLADGRLDVVRKQEADLTLVAEILDWHVRSARTTGDHVSRNELVTLRASLKLYEPFDMEEPLADLGEILIRQGFRTDTRSSRFVAEPDRKESVLQGLADRIVSRTLTGFPTDLAPYALPGERIIVTDVEDVDPTSVLRPRPGTIQ